MLYDNPAAFTRICIQLPPIAVFLIEQFRHTIRSQGNPEPVHGFSFRDKGTTKQLQEHLISFIWTSWSGLLSRN
jgi:hypothetical protein